MERVDAGRAARIILIAGALSLASGCAAPDVTTTPPTPPVSTSPTLSPSEGVRLTVTVHDVVDVEGGAIAGVLYTGPEMFEENAVGGFGAQVDSDPFSITATLMEPGSAFRGLFPYVTDDPLAVPPGGYTLVLWADDAAMTAYGRWAPSLPHSGEPGMYSCQTTFEVGGSDVRLSVAGIPAEPLSASPTLTPCTLD